MDKHRLQWAGAPCGEHGSYTFYKAIKFFKNGRWRIVSLGDFFFLKFSETDPLCIGELQLLWEDRSNDGLMLSSSRFYFLPESTPDGRKVFHGEDEVIAVDGKAVFKLEDLLDWVCTDVAWNRGSLAVCSKDVKGPAHCINNNGQVDEDFALNNSKLNYADVKQEKKLIGDDETRDRVKIMSYPSYCRYKTAIKRLEHSPDAWLNDALVRPLGGFTVPHRNTRLMYCKDEFEHPTLVYHEKLCDHLAPNLKGRPRKKKNSVCKEKTPPLQTQTSEDSIPETRTADKAQIKQAKHIDKAIAKKVKQGRKHKHRKSTDDNGSDVFLPSESDLETSTEGKEKMLTEEKVRTKKGRKSMESHLLAYMKSINKPITRVPNLGFKPIDIGKFWKLGQKLGGYDEICKNRTWKKIYDILGGSTESTSAATCTRRHYEKLILPYERHLKGLSHLPLPKPYRRPKVERSNDNEDDQEEEDEEENEEDKNPKVKEEPQESFKIAVKQETKQFKQESLMMGDAEKKRELMLKSIEALQKKKRQPREKPKKLKDQLKELREKKAQMTLQPIATNDGNLLIQGLNLPPPGTTISDTKPNLTGVMADQAAFLLPNQIPSSMMSSDRSVLFSNVPTSHGGIAPITVSSEGHQGSLAPVILTIPSLHPSMNPGVIAANNQVTTHGSVVSTTSNNNNVKPMFFPVNGSSGVITRASVPTMHITSFASSPPVSLPAQTQASQFLQPNLTWSGKVPAGIVPPVSISAASMAHSQNTTTSSTHFSPIPGSVITSRPSVIQHTQHARTQPYMHGNAISPSDLILRNMSPRKTPTPNKRQTEKSEKSTAAVNTSTGRDPIIVTPHFNPYLPGFPGLPGMMLPGQLPFQTGVVPPVLRDQPMTTKRRRTESGKENLDGKPTDPTNMPQMPFFPVSVPMPIPRLVHPFQSVPEQDEPCDLSMPKKRKHNDVERQLIRDRKQSASPHVRNLHGTKSGRSVLDFPSELSNHRTQTVNDNSSRHHNSSHGKIVVSAEDHHKIMTEHHKLLHSAHVKMTPLPRGSITQGVINPPTRDIGRSRNNRDSISTKHSHSKSISKDTPTQHIPHTTTSIPSIPSDHQSKGQMIMPDFSSPHILAAAAANGFPPRFPFVPPHLLNPQLLANLPPHLAGNREEFLRRGFMMPPMGFPPPGLVGGAMSPPQVKKEGQATFAFHS